jgi:hypothetical protein
MLYRPVMRVARWLGFFAALAAGCAHEVIELDPPSAPLPALESRLPFTVTVRTGSFDASRLSPDGVALHFADRLRASGLVDGVIHPAPHDLSPLWAIELTARDGGSEPDANFWKSALAHALPPALPFVYLENDYALELSALLIRRRELVATYRARTSVRHRYQLYADRSAMEREALASLARRAAQQILAQIAADAERLRAEDLVQTGR